MVDLVTKTRRQGLDERPKQQDVQMRVLTQKEQTKTEREKLMDKINQNKITYRQEAERRKDVEKLAPQIGLPEMERKEATQEEHQANQHQNQVFAGAKATERYRMGKEAFEQAEARKKHGFTMDDKDANRRVLEAGNNPTPKAKDDLDKQLTKQERQMRAVFKNPNIPFKKKIEFFKKMIRGIKGKAPLKGAKQVERGKRLMKEVKPHTRKVLGRVMAEQRLKLTRGA